MTEQSEDTRIYLRDKQIQENEYLKDEDQESNVIYARLLQL